ILFQLPFYILYLIWSALVGSCVVIPCSFDYPSPQKVVRQFTGIWADETSHVIYHPEERKALVQYRNRTKLVGDLHGKNCSLKIDPVQTSDKGPYHFRIEIAQYNNYSYKENAVSVTSTSKLITYLLPLQVMFAQYSTHKSLCSVSHTCPEFPPHFTWSHAGQKEVQHKIEGALWTTTSTLIFQVGHSDHNKPLECTVSHRGGTQQTANTVLSVKCKTLYCHIYIYIGVSIGAALLLLSILLLVVARK
uniref:Ig-like domain-containing protein n=1 Tax=Periophthalmus magnuspinnatus TaxID=409849 RepID=A0A3B3ZFA3_9GOBI